MAHGRNGAKVMIERSSRAMDEAGKNIRIIEPKLSIESAYTHMQQIFTLK
jgi:hypothetical protein